MGLGFQRDWVSVNKAVYGIANNIADGTGATTSAAIDTNHARKIILLVAFDTVGSSATLDCKLTECATSGGTYADVTSGSITQQTAAGLTVLEVTTHTERYIKVVLTVGTAASDASAHVILTDSQLNPNPA